jgi:hypothetical protein
MFDQAKYIIVESNGLEMPIVFASLLKHKEVAGARKVVAAGFVFFRHGHGGEETNMVAECFGMSTSLEISSRPGIDDKLIERFILQE